MGEECVGWEVVLLFHGDEGGTGDGLGLDTGTTCLGVCYFLLAQLVEQLICCSEVAVLLLVRFDVVVDVLCVGAMCRLVCLLSDGWFDG